MNIRSIAYCIATILTAFVFLSGGAVYLIRAKEPLEGMAALGYPRYFVTILGVRKILGGLAILAPRTPRLKEWAYAGITFDLTGAAISQSAMHDPAWHIAVPLVILAIAAVFWALRPPSRVVGTSMRTVV